MANTVHWSIAYKLGLIEYPWSLIQSHFIYTQNSALPTDWECFSLTLMAWIIMTNNMMHKDSESLVHCFVFITYWACATHLKMQLYKSNTSRSYVGPFSPIVIITLAISCTVMQYAGNTVATYEMLMLKLLKLKSLSLNLQLKLN